MFFGSFPAKSIQFVSLQKARQTNNFAMWALETKLVGIKTLGTHVRSMLRKILPKSACAREAQRGGIPRQLGG